MKKIVVSFFVVVWVSIAFAWTLSTSSIDASANGGSFTIAVSGSENYDWFAGSSVSWISVTKSSAKSFSVSVRANTESEERSGAITINAYPSGGPYSASTWIGNQGCTVWQQAGTGGGSSGGSGDTPVETDVSPKSIIIGEMACMTSVTITASGAWTVANKLDWVSVDKTEGYGEAQIRLSFSANVGRQGRSGLLTVAGKTVALYQECLIEPCGVTNVVARQRYPFSGKVDIDYDVKGDLAKSAQEAGLQVSLEVAAEDILTGERYVASEIAGDLALTEGKHSVVWDMEKQGLSIKSDQVLFSVSCQTNAPLYCILDLSAGSGGASYPVSYTNAIPGGTWSDEYRTTKLALRRIEPGSVSFRGNDITLTKPYFVSVFEMTQAQWSRIEGENNSSSVLPVGLWYNSIRGKDQGALWPASSSVDQNSLMGKLRARTGVKFDLLTYSQWLYAYQAGTTTRFYWGDQYSWETDQTALYAWCNPYSLDTYKVGALLPNNWGIYDMSGNVSEWVLDRWCDSTSQSGVYVGFDPIGVDDGVASNGILLRCHAGGCAIDHKLGAPTDGPESEYVSNDGSDRGRYRGVRLSLTMDQASMGLDKTKEMSSEVPINTIETTHAPFIDYVMSGDSVVVNLTWENDWPIYYSCDGSEPTADSARCADEIMLDARGARTIKAIAISSTGEKSEVATLEISAPNSPTISPADKTILTAATSVNVASDNPDATIYFTTDGSEPTTSSPVYKRFKVSSKMTVKAIAVVEGMAWSETAVAEYALGQCTDPTITPTDGTVFGSSNYQVSIAKNGEKGVLRYTTDGSDPTEASPVYSGPFAISETTTVNAKVFDTDYFDSAVVSATLTRQWTKVATPVIFAPETFSGTKLSVSLTCATDGAVIRYTTDGSEPNSHSPKYTKPFDITGTTVVKAIALKTDCVTSDVATMTISKQWCIGDALNDSERQFTTDVGTGWVRDTSVSHDGSESMKSGSISDSATAGVYAMSTLSAVVDGKGTVRFWWKASCEEDDEYEWDHGEFRVDGVTVARINGTAGWSEVVHEISSGGSHTIAWVYCKDDFGKVDEDSIWVDQFAWQLNDPIPDLGDNPAAQQIAAALDGSSDVRLAQNITDGATYGKYRTWAAKVKAKGGTDPVGAEAVVASTNAWLSFALDSGTLIETAPRDGDVRIESFSPTAVGGAFELAVGVEGVYIGEGAAVENLATLFGVEGGGMLDVMSSDKVSVSFGVPTNGKVKLTAGPKDATQAMFFMRIKMTP